MEGCHADPVGQRRTVNVDARTGQGSVTVDTDALIGLCARR
jgi:hypothetical protein